MHSLPDPPPRIAVIGGGISGLSAAHRLHELCPAAPLTLLEAGSRLGGVIHTVEEAGYLIEESADSFITNLPWAIELCQRIGLDEELLPTDESRRRAFVAHRGRLEPLPEGFLLMAPRKMWPIAFSRLLSLRGKLRMAAEYFVPARKETADESLASFVRRRLGKEAFDRLVQPLVGGIYTADPERLSMAATMAQFVAMEQQHGGLIRGARQAARKQSSEESGARYSMFVTPKGGLSSLIDALHRRLPPGSVRLNSPVEQVARVADGRWQLQIAGVAEPLWFDRLIIALPAPRASRLVRDIDSTLADELAGIEYAGASIVVVGYRREQVRHPLDGFGFVVPAVERRRILAGSFSSVKFPGRAPEERVLIRVFFGGACQRELGELPDDQLRQIVAEELGELLGVRGEPELFHVARWQGAMPQYHVGHVERVARIAQRVADQPGLELAGNAFQGVGIPQCVRSGEQAAARLLGVSR